MRKKVLFKGGILLLSLLLLPGLSGCGAVSSLMATPTPPPTPTPTPTPVIIGRIVEAPLSSTIERPDLRGALIVLCQKTSATKCVISRERSTTSNDNQEFAFYNIPSGEYIVLYNPFPVADSFSYWQHWDNRTLDFADRRSLSRSLGGSGRIVNWIEEGNYVVSWLEEYPLLIEFLQKDVPLSVSITTGQTSEVIIKSHAFVP